LRVQESASRDRRGVRRCKVVSESVPPGDGGALVAAAPLCALPRAIVFFPHLFFGGCVARNLGLLPDLLLVASSQADSQCTGTQAPGETGGGRGNAAAQGGDGGAASRNANACRTRDLNAPKELFSCVATLDGKDPRTWVVALACGRAAADMESMAAISSDTGCACVSANDAGDRRVLRNYRDGVPS